MLSHWREHTDLFPNVPSQSRFNRRRRHLMLAFNLIRQYVLQVLDLAQERECVIDSLPVPVVQFYLVPGSTGDWAAFGARFGKVTSKKETIFGYKLHLLVTLGGVILDFELAPANATDLEVGFEMLAEHTHLTALGEKTYISAEKAAELWHTQRVRLQTIPRRNQHRQISAAARRAINTTRQIIETNHAHTFWGLVTRLYTKLTAHTLCIYLNRLLGNPDFLQIKRLAFPI